MGAAGKLPPHDLDAEAVVLSDLLAIPAHIALVRGGDVGLRPGDFFSTANGLICRALYALDDGGEAIDTTLVASWLRSRDKLDHAGGTAYIGQLIDATPATANVREHAAVVVDRARVRRAIAALQTHAAKGYGDIGEAQEWLEAIAGDFARHAQDGKRGGAVVMSVAAESTARAVATAHDPAARVTGIGTGLREVDNITAGLHPELTMLGAKTGGGKSAYSGQLALVVAGAADRDGVHRNGCIVFSLEMPREHYTGRWACNLARVPWEDVRKARMTSDQYGGFLAALDALTRLPIVIDDRGDRQAMSLEAIRAETLRQKQLFEAAGKRLALVVIDYYQLIDWRLEAGRHGSRYEGLDEIAKRLKRLPSETGACVVVCAQLNNDGNVRDCPAAAHHAHNFQVLTIDKTTGPGARESLHEASLRIKKQRHGAHDVSAAFWFQGEFLRFCDDC